MIKEYSYILPIKNIKLDDNWIVGFVEHSGHFTIWLIPDDTKCLNTDVVPEFFIKVDYKEIKLLYAIKEFFKCGVVLKSKDRQTAIFSVKTLKHHYTVILPFFDKYDLKSSKQKNYLRYRWIIKAMVYKYSHCEPFGLREIMLIKNIMDKNNNFIYPILEDRVHLND